MATLEERVQQLENQICGIGSRDEIDKIRQHYGDLEVWKYCKPSQLAPIANIEGLELQVEEIEEDIQNLGIYYAAKKELDEVNRKIGSLPEGKTNLVGYVDTLQNEVAALKAATDVTNIYKLPYTGAEFGAKLAKI